MKRIANALWLLSALTTAVLPAQTFTVLFSFYPTAGESPFAGLVQGSDGNLYGTTATGSAGADGTVFKIAPAGGLTPLYRFCSQTGCTDGFWPDAGLVQAADGNFYGTTYLGGAGGRGTVFKITPAGALTTLYSFCSQTGCADGSHPDAGLLRAGDAYFYGTTRHGGAHGGGTVFKITPDGTLTTVYSFCSQAGCADGQEPQTALVQAGNGDLYGTTTLGGANQCGTVFRISPIGALATVYSFCSQSSCRDGVAPNGSLVQSPDGDFYGTTMGGGSHGQGTVFKMTSGGALTTLHNFCSQDGCADGGMPRAALVLATDGNFYGTTSSNGGTSNNGGTIFRITPGGSLTTLYSFCPENACAGGASPYASLIQDTNGDFYGTTPFADANHSCSEFCGAIFSLSVGLGPFVETQTTSGKVGSSVKILGTLLAGATGVTFNGATAAFRVVSGSEIAATVPVNASTGTVQVVTPTGTLSSNAPFHVLP